MTDHAQKEVCRKCGISAKSVLRCSQTVAPECAYMQMALVLAEQNARGQVQSAMSLQSTVEACGNIINDTIAKVALKGVGK